MSLKFHLMNIPFEFERFIFSKIPFFRKNRSSSAPFLSGDTFRKISDFIYDEDKKCSFSELNSWKFSEIPIVFVSTFLLTEFREKVFEKLSTQIILITHNSDTNIMETSEFIDLLNDEKLVHWYAQNCLIQHNKITPLPIGLENRYRHNAGALRDYKSKKMQQSKKFPKILFGFSLHTNPKKRVPCYLSLAKKDNSVEITNAPNAHIYRKILCKYMFVASPEGNGLDCHRTWEAMYFNVIPIVERNYMTEFFSKLNLPIWIIDSFDELTKYTSDELSHKYKDIISKSNKEALFFDYWKKNIENSKFKGETI